MNLTDRFILEKRRIWSEYRLICSQYNALYCQEALKAKDKQTYLCVLLRLSRLLELAERKAIRSVNKLKEKIERGNFI